MCECGAVGGMRTWRRPAPVPPCQSDLNDLGSNQGHCDRKASYCVTKQPQACLEFCYVWCLGEVVTTFSAVQRETGETQKNLYQEQL
jgi:hypothetical protein